MIGSKQTHIFIRKSGQFMDRRVDEITEMKYDIGLGMDNMKMEK